MHQEKNNLLSIQAQIKIRQYKQYNSANMNLRLKHYKENIDSFETKLKDMKTGLEELEKQYRLQKIQHQQIIRQYQQLKIENRQLNKQNRQIKEQLSQLLNILKLQMGLQQQQQPNKTLALYNQVKEESSDQLSEQIERSRQIPKKKANRNHETRQARSSHVPEDIKRENVKLIRRGEKGVIQVARQLSVNLRTVYRWLEKY